jgi:uncharacterized membrane protein
MSGFYVSVHLTARSAKGGVSMDSMLWIVIAVIGLALCGLGLRFFVTRGFSGARGTTRNLPMAWQQRRAWGGLVLGLVVLAALVTVVVVGGATTFSQNRQLRLLTLAIFFAGMIGYLVILAVTRPRGSDVEIAVDERDRAIMARATSVALVVGFITLIGWTVGLTEAFWDQAAIPIDFPTYVLWTTAGASLLGREIGILMGYAGWWSRGES